MIITTQQINNFWKKVIKTDSCWIWTACVNMGGYGKFNINGQWFLAHRVALMLNGVLPVEKKKESGSKGEIVLHTCDNSRCVNPAHLTIADQKTNVRDCHSKKRAFIPVGSKSGRARLNESNVKTIRDLLASEKYTQTEIAKKFHVPSYLISNIKTNRTWTHV